MPVDCRKPDDKNALYQRDLYRKSRITRLYWDYRDGVILENIPSGSKIILDAGCGEGITLERLVRSLPKSEITGVDISEENVRICAGYGLPALRGDIACLQIPDGAVDCCILSEIVEHLDHPLQALAEIRRILKASGRIIIVFPNDTMFKIARILTFKFREAFYDPGHLRQWTPSVIRSYLEAAGFTVRNLRNIPFGFWPLSLHCVVTGCKRE
jgi:ubiquinone/menaquinone biosynthesis C-methylase UbiE